MNSDTKRQFRFFSLIWDDLYPGISLDKAFNSLKDVTIQNLKYDFKKVPFSDELIDQIALKTLNIIIRRYCKENHYIPFKLKKYPLSGKVVAYLLGERECCKCGKTFWWLTEKWEPRKVYCSLECRGNLKGKVVVSVKSPIEGYQVNEFVKVITIK